MKKKKELLSHISLHRQEYIWAAIALFFIVMSSMQSTLFAGIIISLITIIPMMTLTWLLRRILIPRFLHRQSWTYYLHSFFAITFLSIAFSSIEGQLYRYLFLNDYIILSDSMSQAIEAGGIVIGHIYFHAKFFTLLTITLAVVTVSHLLDERKSIEIETKDQNMQMEMKYLRAQVNPHFLFNALNCIYSLTLSQDAMAADSVLKLSEMMRYVNDDCRADEVPISKEVAYINNYIDFQKIRMEYKPDIRFNCKIENESFAIPPMLFQPMVENCFKHSRIVDDKKAYICISLIQKGEHVLFATENSKHVNVGKNKDEERTGIGVQNVRQRLDLLFGDDYKLEILETENTYKTKLKI